MKKLFFIIIIIFFSFQTNRLFSKEFHKAVRISGNTEYGYGKLKLTRYLNSYQDTGFYTGQCKDNLPHGKGTLVIKGNYTWIKNFNWKTVTGNWKHGEFHGTMTFIFKNKPYLTREEWEYENGEPHEKVKCYNKYGDLVKIETYKEDKLYVEKRKISETPYKNGTLYEPSFSESYIKNTINNVEENLSEMFHPVLFYDKYYLKILNQKQLLYEILYLQRVIDRYMKKFYYLKRYGIRIYEPQTSGLLNTFIRMHANRYVRLNVPKAKEYMEGYIETNYLHMFYSHDLVHEDWLFYTKPKNWTKKETIIKTIRKANLLINFTKNLTVILLPFSILETNGYAQDDFIVLFGKDPFPWKGSPSLTMHEIGHVVERQLFKGKSLYDEYWKLREVKPARTTLYDHPKECFAEDFRALFSNWSRADFKRNNPGMFGDIRSYPKKKRQVYKLISNRMRNRKVTRVIFENLSYIKILQPTDKILLRCNGNKSCKYEIYNIKMIERKEKLISIKNEFLKNGLNKISISKLKVGHYKIKINIDDEKFVEQFFIVSDFSGKLPLSTN